VESLFPRLAAEGFQYTSQPSRAYNCVSWAADVDTIRWDPVPLDGYWPASALPEFSVPGLVSAFQTLGYKECLTADYEPGYERIAIYGTSEDDATHAAKQIGPSQWSSKIGDLEDISHTLDGLVGDRYGMVMRFMRRPREATG
jgi:hypothetical protein